MIKQLKRSYYLSKITSLKEFLKIIFEQFISKDLVKKDPALHRLMMFSIACSDNEIKISRYSKELLLISWIENEKRMLFFVRKYSRDLLIFSQFFIIQDSFQYIDKRDLNHLKESVTIIDAGANIGCSALYFLINFPIAQVICIEPEDSNYDLLIKNLEINGLTSRVITLQKAVWNELMELELMQRDWSHDGFHVMQKPTSDEIIAKTSTITIPQIINDYKLSKIDILKMDIEGAEKKIFEDKSYLELFINLTKFIIVEVHEEFISESFVIKVLNRYSFKVKKNGEYLVASNFK
jgi:FkbM family methyltransferase